MKPTSISLKKILSHSKLIYTDMISLQSVELNRFIPDEDLACNKVLEMGCTESTHSWRCLRWCPWEIWLVENSCSYFHHTLGRCSSAHPVKEGFVGCNPDLAWRWHSGIHCTHLILLWASEGHRMGICGFLHATTLQHSEISNFAVKMSLL